MRPIKTVLLACGIFLLAFSATATGVGAREARAPETHWAGNYVVRHGDTLSGIALWNYGNTACWATIWAANPQLGGNPHYIQAGWVLYLPPTCGSYGGYEPPPPVPSYPRYHTVQRGQTLSGIACYYYRDCNYWRIYNANRHLIWYPGYIQAGWTLVIP